MNLEGIQVIGFDADDTLWHNENLFRVTESHLSDMLAPYSYHVPIPELIFRKQIANLPIYGYGIKAFTFALIETAIEASRGQISAHEINQIMNMGKAMLVEPVSLFKDVFKVMESLSPCYKLIVVTKGDLVDQERKLALSGLSHFFHHMEILSRKDEQAYTALLAHLDIDASRFLMIGNSLRSDVLPVLNIGARAIHIPYQTTWEHEHVDIPEEIQGQFLTVTSLTDIPGLLLPASQNQA